MYHYLDRLHFRVKVGDWGVVEICGGRFLVYRHVVLHVVSGEHRYKRETSLSVELALKNPSCPLRSPSSRLADPLPAVHRARKAVVSGLSLAIEDLHGWSGDQVF